MDILRQPPPAQGGAAGAAAAARNPQQPQTPPAQPQTPQPQQQQHQAQQQMRKWIFLFSFIRNLSWRYSSSFDFFFSGVVCQIFGIYLFVSIIFLA